MSALGQDLCLVVPPLKPHTHTHTHCSAWACTERVPNIQFLHKFTELSSNIHPTSLCTPGPGGLGSSGLGKGNPACVPTSVFHDGTWEPGSHLLSIHFLCSMFTACRSSPCSWQGKTGSIPSPGQPRTGMLTSAHHLDPSTVLAPKWG